MNCWSKKKIKPSDLLPKEKGKMSGPSEYEQKRSMPKTIDGIRSMMRKRKEDAEEKAPGNLVDPFVMMGLVESDTVSYDEDIDLSGFGEGE